MSVVKIVTNTPGKAPKATKSEGIKDVKVPEGMVPMTARGMGAAKKGGSYMGCK